MTTIKGKIEKIGEAKHVGPNQTYKQELIINASFAADKRNPVPIVVFGDDKADFLLNAQAGDEVEIDYTLRGNEYTPPNGGETRNYVEVQAYRISKIIRQSFTN